MNVIVLMKFIDQLDRIVELEKIPERIVSLVPSQTELLYDLGLGDRVVGITKFCIHPEVWFRNKKRVGGTKNFKVEVIRELRPDLILANKEENTKEGLEELARTIPVWISDVKHLPDALGMIRSVGLMLDKIDEAEAMVSMIEGKRLACSGLVKRKCAYLIWRNPYMTIGGDTFIHEMLAHAGWENVFGKELRYPSIGIEDLASCDAEVIFLSSEPFPFKEQHLKEIEEGTGKQAVIVDGEAFSWYGSRLLHVWEYFRKLNNQLS